ncbi:MAG: aspartate/tyrosine/aromatic aminotransferase [Proteobacteria bacterium]|nr:aspartate/tyrosine/aromatic aminotransferase [Pseudomonadota bacterium]MCL2308055.1 aspartate/tyrosine/aromatic aminotransferase [Pseudomonadota bacterium]
MFAEVPLAARDPILGLNEAYQADANPKKVNLSIGVYYDAAGKIPVLSCVQKAMNALAGQTAPRTYQPMEGPAVYTQAVQKLLLGADHPAIRDGRVATAQTIAGTGALKTGFDLLFSIIPKATAWVSNPTWDNHRAILGGAGFPVETYAYYDATTGGFDLAGMLRDLERAKAGDLVLLHACCHNPTGVDPTADEWGRIIDTIEQRKLVPFIDIAYQGFGDGLQEDGEVIRRFAERNLPVFIANSFSKTFSLYGERVGALTVLTANADEAQRVLSQIKRVVRASYSTPPIFGASLVSTVLNQPDLRVLWEEELATMRNRIREMRQMLRERLSAQVPGRNYDYITQQRGMFSYSGLSAAQAQKLREDYAIYIVESGRICVAGLNTSNIDYVAEAVAAVQKG